MSLISKGSWSCVLAAFVIAVTSGGFGGCGDTGGTGGDGDADADADTDADADADADADEGQYLIEAYMGGPVSLDGFTVYVGRLYETDPSAEEATVTINGTAVSLRPLLSDADDAVYYAAGVGYSPGATFDVEASLGGRTASCQFTAPTGADIAFDPDEDITLTAGDPLELAWVVSGGAPEKLHLYVSNTESEETPVDVDLDPTATSYTVPGAETAGWTGASYLASIDLGEYAYPFTGALAAGTSVTTLVLPGAAVTVYMAE